MKKIFLTALLVCLLLSSFPFSVQAICDEPIVPCGREGTPSCVLCHAFELLVNVLKFILTCLSPIAAVLMIAVGGLFYVASGMDPEILSRAKSIIVAALIGFIIIFVSWMLLNTFLTAMGVADWLGFKEGGWEIQCISTF